MVQPFQLSPPITVQNEKWNLIPGFHFQMMIAMRKSFFSALSEMHGNLGVDPPSTYDTNPTGPRGAKKVDHSLNTALREMDG